jgi:microcystin-dependent protein
MLGTVNDDGANLLQVAGDIGTSGALQAGRGTTKAVVNSDQATAYYYASGDGQAFLGGNGKGWTSLITAGAERMRVTNAGRVLIGSLNDDGKNLLQVNGNAAFANGVISRGLDHANGGQFRAAGNNFGAFLRIDDSNAYLLSTNKGDPYGAFNGYRPFSWSLEDGAVKIAFDGSPTFINGTTTIEKDLQVKNGVISRGSDRGNGGQFRAAGASYGAFLRNDDSNVYLLSTSKGDPFGGYNDLRPFAWSLDTGTVKIASHGADTYIGGNAIVGSDLHVNRGNNEGHIFLGTNTGYLYGNADSFGWWWPDKGASLQYFATDHTLRVDGQLVWHLGNLTPLDRNLGGQMLGDLNFAPGKRIFLSEGSASAPSLTFINDGAPDTGLYHMADGHFGVTCNGIGTVHFAPEGTYFDQPAFSLHPPAGEKSNRVPTTAWVSSEIAAASIGQIVFEPRTNARAGFVKANGAPLNRADYPALWAYAQASGALVAEKDWANGNWGCFSDGNGSTTFRIPELRGEFIRCWADGRDDIDAQRRIGTYQDSQNIWHAHGASSSTADDHVHNAWADGQGVHNHHGVTGANGNHQHIAPYSEVNVAPWGVAAWSQLGSHGGIDYDNPWAYTSPAGDHNHEFWTDVGGAHNHAIGIGGGGRHSHGITVNADGGKEARPRNIAMLAMIRAY